MHLQHGQRQAKQIQCSSFTSDYCSNSEEDETFPKMTLLSEYNKDTIDQIVVDAIFGGHVRLLTNTRSLCLSTDKSNSLGRFLLFNGIFALRLSKVLCVHQASYFC
jgi:hypothetical protein